MPLKKYFAAVASFAALCVFPAAAAGEPMEWPCRGRCIDAAWIANKGWAYFFAGGRYWRYDIAHNKVDLGDTEVTYPRPLRTVPGFPSAWSSGVDAVLNSGDGYAYWFKGRDYVRYAITGEMGQKPEYEVAIDDGPLPIAKRWPGLPPAWSGDFTAAVNWGNGKVTFFKGREALNYDLASNTAAGPRPIADILRGLPIAWASGIDAAVNWGDGKLYIFKGHEYLRYDIASDKVEGAPRPIATDWPGLMTLVDWVNWSAKLPDYAMKVGHERDNSPHFLCAVMDGKAIYPGKLWSKNSSCYYTDGRRELQSRIYAVATTKLSIAWTAKASAPADRLIPVGVSPGGRVYYLCRAPFGNGVHPGRIETLAAGCTIPYDGRSLTLDDGVEVAVAPTAVNHPNIPHIVRMLSPLPNSEKFKDVCAGQVALTLGDPSAAARYPEHLPDVKTLFQIVSRNTCAMLYRQPSEVPRYAKKVELVFQKDPNNPAEASATRWDTHSRITLSPDLYASAGSKLMNLVRLFHHEGTHTTQQTTYGIYGGPLNEGVADYVLFTAWQRRIGRPGGDWKDGYDITAYFLQWLEGRYPDFVYKLNGSAAGRGKPWTPEVFRTITGKSVDAIWQEYMAAQKAAFAGPEAALRARNQPSADAVDAARGCQVAVYWDDDFRGDVLRTSRDLGRLAGGWNDQISSIAITAGVWEFFEHDTFKGQVLKLIPGRHANLGKLGWNDRISSFRCVEPTPVANRCEVAVYWDSDFKGDVLRSSEEMPMLTFWSDKISSIVIAHGTWEFAEHWWFAGKVLKLPPGRYARLPEGWNDTISSFRCVEPSPVPQASAVPKPPSIPQVPALGPASDPPPLIPRVPKLSR